MSEIHTQRGRIGRPTVLLIALAVPAGAAAVFTLRQDPPSIPRPKAGRIIGTLSPAADVAKLSAVSRVTRKRYQPAQWDRSTGQFRFDDLCGDASYDLCLELTDGRRIEGIDLSWHEVRFQRMAATRRKQLGIPELAARAFTEADAAELGRFIADRKDFSDVNRPLYIRGLGRKAVVLAERIRTERFHGAAPGEIIWRTDLMYFTRAAGGWVLTADTRRLVERRQFGPGEMDGFTLAYDPALTVRLEADGRAKPVVYTIAREFSAAIGRLAGQPIESPAQPVVFGLDRPASAPADRSGNR